MQSAQHLLCSWFHFHLHFARLAFVIINVEAGSKPNGPLMRNGTRTSHDVALYTKKESLFARSYLFARSVPNFD